MAIFENTWLPGIYYSLTLDAMKNCGLFDQLATVTVYGCRSVRVKSECDVDMRVGIHTGKVLGGVIGQKQWQYDVMSIEVNVANQMESFGIPGKVHISQTVLDHLNGEFEVEKRERLDEMLICDMDTYLVTSVKREVCESSLNECLFVLQTESASTVSFFLATFNKTRIVVKNKVGMRTLPGLGLYDQILN